ncbi:TolC family protein [Sphingobium sp.]|uniref:TolC family protein n=1 Tax=Sphingobium sp. TaxID=1912891 RepID=UPI002C1E4F85|nr:TolC family protein [Sphingobium sp.]HUD93288.1 TolC family protein [Sphingobium sp.]
MHRIIAAFLAATTCVAVTQAQESIAAQRGAAPILTLDQAVSAAGGNAPATDAAQADIAASRAARTVAGLRPNPELQTQVENVAGSGPYGGFSQAETTVGLNIPIELGGKRGARIAVAEAQTSRALLVAAITQADIRLQVTQLYVDVVAAERRLATARDQLRIAQDALSAAKVRVQAGRASPIEEQRADVAHLNAGAGMQRAQRLAEAARTNLGRRIGRVIEDRLDATALDSLPDATQGPSLVTGEGTLALAAASADVAIADAGVRLAQSQRMPDLTAGPAVRRLEASNDTAAVFSLSIPIPLFNAGKAALSQANAERTRAEAQRRMAAIDVEQAITDAQATADNAATTARNATGPALAAAQEAARIARIGYREGKFGQLDLLDAERTLSDTRVAAIDALAAYQNARAQLERLTAPVPQQEIDR